MGPEEELLEEAGAGSQGGGGECLGRRLGVWERERKTIKQNLKQWSHTAD